MDLEHPNIFQLVEYREDLYNFFLIFDAPIIGP